MKHPQSQFPYLPRSSWLVLRLWSVSTFEALPSPPVAPPVASRRVRPSVYVMHLASTPRVSITSYRNSFGTLPGAFLVGRSGPMVRPWSGVPGICCRADERDESNGTPTDSRASVYGRRTNVGLSVGRSVCPPSFLPMEWMDGRTLLYVGSPPTQKRVPSPDPSAGPPASPRTFCLARSIGGSADDKASG